MTALLDAALGLAARGYHVFPLKPGGKTPLTDHGFHDAARDDQTIRAWWGKWSDANIGIACGASGIIVVDGDPKHGCNAEQVVTRVNGATVVGPA